MNIDKQIEFDKIKKLWSELALTDWAKEQIEQIKCSYSEIELRAMQRETTTARELIQKVGTPPLQNITEIKDVLMIVEKGACLTTYQIERVEKVLVVVKRLKDYLSRGKVYQNSLAYYDESLDEIPELRDEIRNKIRGSIVDDCASKELEQIRRQIIECDEQMKQKAEQVLRSNKGCMTDNYCTMRNGRICVPVKKEYRFKVSGSVIDKSSTGSTLFIESAGVAKYYEKLQREILPLAVKMLRPGGMLLYSTCTFSPEEDEQMLSFLLSNYPDLHVVRPALSYEGFAEGRPEWANGEEEIRHAIRLFPHLLEGEGHFVALLQKDENEQNSAYVTPSYYKKPALSKEAEEFFDRLGIELPKERLQVRDEKIYLMPEGLPELTGLRILRSGLLLGEMKKNRFEPSQSLAMCLKKEEYKRCVSMNAEDERILKYIQNHNDSSVQNTKAKK